MPTLTALEIENKSTASRYAIAAFAAVLALMLRGVLAPMLGDQAPYLTLFPAIVFSAWYLGLGPSILTAVIGLAGVWYWFITPFHSFALDHPIPQISGMVGFLILVSLMIAMGSGTRDARQRERQLIAEAMEATAKFRALFEQSPVFAGVMTLDGTVIDVNRLSLEACGYRADEVLGRVFWDTPWWRHSKEVQAKIHAATLQAARGLAYREDLPYVVADGSNRFVDFGLHPVCDDQGRVIFLHPTGTDITDRKLAEEKFRKLTERLETEVQARTQELHFRNEDILRQTDLLRVLSQRLMEVQDAERRRIARELHDSAGQLLSVLSINLSSLTHQAKSKAPELSETADECHRIVQQLSQEIRTMSYLLHPPLLDEIGLTAALDWYAKGLAERSSLEIDLRIPDKLARLPHELELAVFRVVQECLTNIHRHSESKTASIHLAIQAETLLLEIKDQGKGIPPEKLSQIQSHGSGVGIQGIRERLRPFNAQMRIESSDSGTTVTVAFKIPPTSKLNKSPAV